MKMNQGYIEKLENCWRCRLDIVTRDVIIREKTAAKESRQRENAMNKLLTGEVMLQHKFTNVAYSLC
jgi:hypothetical protein